MCKEKEAAEKTEHNRLERERKRVTKEKAHLEKKHKKMDGGSRRKGGNRLRNVRHMDSNCQVL